MIISYNYIILLYYYVDKSDSIKAMNYKQNNHDGKLLYKRLKKTYIFCTSNIHLYGTQK